MTTRRDTTFGARLKEARTARGLTQVELAVRVGMAQSEIASIENGRPVMLQTAVKFADALVVSLDWLAGRTGRSGPGGPRAGATSATPKAATR